MTIYEEIRAERAAQDAQWGGPTHDDRHVSADWVFFIVEHAFRAIRDPKKSFRKQMIRIAALAVAAVEAEDRHTALPGV